MSVLGSIPAGDVEVVTWCKTTYGTLLYDVVVGGERFQIDLEENDSLQKKLDKIAGAHASVVKGNEEKAKLPKSIEVDSEDEGVIKEIIANKGAGVLMLVPSSEVDRVQKISDKVVVVTPKK